MQLRKQRPSHMASTPTAATPGTTDSTEQDGSGLLPEDRQLEFRERHQLTIDAQAHALLDPKYAREMRAVPLGMEAGRPVVAVADPSEKRLEALRKLVPGDTKFVLVAPESLDALLKSRIFNESMDGAEVTLAPEQKLSTTAEAEPASVPTEAPAPVEPVPAPVEAAPVAVDAAPVVAPVAQAPAPAPAPAAPPAQPLPTELFDAANVNQLAAQLAQAANTLLALQSQVQGIAAHFEQTRQELREQKEQLAAAAAKSDQDRARIKSVAASLAEDVAKLEATKTDLAERLSGLVLDDQAG
jgi:Type II secretion system (T2SS), protein E, N-terminal domain